MTTACDNCPEREWAFLSHACDECELDGEPAPWWIRWPIYTAIVAMCGGLLWACIRLAFWLGAR
jgi:hypothetical protein